MSTPQEKVEALIAAGVHLDPRADGGIDTDEDWPEPTPLVRPTQPAPEFPIDSLGAVLGAAARAIAETVQVPPALAANSVLAAAALAGQQQANVEILGGGDRPISLYVLTIAASGDRKSSADKIALSSVHDYTRLIAKTYEVKKAEWDRAESVRKLQRRKAQNKAKTSEEYASALKEIKGEPPPRRPRVICTEPTAEGLLLSLRDGQLGQGIFSDEAGTFLGGHALTEEARLRTIAMLSRAWQGDALDRVRAQDAENVTLYGRRLSMHLMAQPDVAALMLANPLYRSQGFLARCLITAPNSLAGTRLYNSARNSLEDSRIDRYLRATSDLLARQPIEDREVGGLDVPRLRLTPEARAHLIKAYNEIEIAQAPKGSLEAGREWAAKSGEHACRIAGVITLVENPDATHVLGETMQGALVLTRYYLKEYLRLVGTAGVCAEIQHAQALLTWLEQKRLREVTPRRIMQYGPNSLRDAEIVSKALKTLTAHNWVQKKQTTGNKYLVHHSLVATMPRE